MYRQFIYLVIAVFCLNFVTADIIRADLVGWWKLDDGSGTTTIDSSGNGNHGMLTAGTAGSPKWKTTTGDFQIGSGALEFHGGAAAGEGDLVDCGNSALFDITENITFALWVKIDAFTMTYQYVFSKGHQYMILRANDTRYLRVVFNGLDTGAAGDAYYAGGTTIPIDDGQWHHVAASYDSSTGVVAFYTDGVLEESKISSGSIPLNTDSVCIGRRNEPNRKGTDAIIDDVRLFNHTLNDVEILSAMYGEPYVLAFGPSPEDGVLNSDTWVYLSWHPGEFAVSHDLYIGDDFDVVNEATRDSGEFQGNQTDTFYIAGFSGNAYPEGLEPGTTYYWRIDEVNETEPNSPWKGNVWSFSIPPKTAYNPDPADGGELVPVSATLTWTPGFGAKLHTTYFGDDFNTVNNATGGTESGVVSYTPGRLELAKTYYWRIDEFDGNGTYKGNVWSFTTEGAVNSPNPANGSVDVSPTQTLTWNAGTVAASHELYFGSEMDTIANTTKSSPEYKGPMALGEESYDPGKLTLNTTYYWRIDEVNAVNSDSPWTGKVWSFTTGDFFVIDDFEDYDVGNNEIWWAWKDGLGYVAHGNEPVFSGNGTGAAVGDEGTLSYTEETNVQQGNQSMPFLYDNNKQGYANYSEAQLTLTAQRDWTDQGVAELSIWFRGEPDNDAEPLYVAVSNTTGNPAVVVHDYPDAAKVGTWTEWIIPLSAFADQGINMTNVDKIALGLGTKGNTTMPGGSGKMYFDNIRLYQPRTAP